MDAFDFHPYPDNSRTPPDLAHPLNSTVSLADYTKLVSLLGKAFDGTAQLGSRLPIYYDEYGVQSQIPGRKDAAYTNLLAPSAGDAVSEAIQADYYRWAIDLAYCQPTVKAFLIFHVPTRPTSTAGSPACSTPTTRRSRRWRPSGPRRSPPGQARSRLRHAPATACSCRSSRTRRPASIRP